MKLAVAVRRALTDLDPQARDQAAAELALAYARAADSGGDLEKLGPLLLTVLEALHMTPRARAAVMKGTSNDSRKSPLDELRARRAARQRDPEAVDATAS